jgi:hypothetical protein
MNLKDSKVINEINVVIQGKETTNVQKMNLIKSITIRLNREQKETYSRLSIVEKKPILKAIRTSIDAKAKATLLAKKPLTPTQLVQNFKAFQKKLGLVKN